MRAYQYVFLVITALLALHCGSDHQDKFPGYLPNMTYPNGHTLTHNETDQICSELETKLAELVNAERAKIGVVALYRLSSLDALGRGHCMHEYEHGFYDHFNPEGDGPAERLGRAGARMWGLPAENLWIVSSTATAEDILQGFMGSPGHRDNILASYSTHFGVGIVRAPNGQLHVAIEFVSLFHP